MPKTTPKKRIVSTVQKLAYTRDELAFQLGVHPITISRLTKDRKLRPSRACGRPLYSHDEVQRFLKETALSPMKA